MNDYHITVLLNEAVEALKIKADGKYVDCTFGAGGHAKQIINQLGAKGHLYAFDQDEDASLNLSDENRLSLIEANFRYLKKFLRLNGVHKVDGILADLGVSSHHLDEGERGFSYRFDAPLDMRMNRRSDTTAADLIHTIDEGHLVSIFSDFGEVRNAKTLAAAIVKHRKISPIKTTFDLNKILESNAIGPKIKYFSQVYQAIRMEVNDEIGALKEMLVSGLDVLDHGGRFVVITFHSIEDRVVKNFFKFGNTEGIAIKDEYGLMYKPFDLVNKKVIEASAHEQKINPRSRSAKMRIAIKR
jgi:16S rRNA (cytosine1402-N4)-methyltransferase